MAEIIFQYVGGMIFAIFIVPALLYVYVRVATAAYFKSQQDFIEELEHGLRKEKDKSQQV